MNGTDQETLNVYGSSGEPSRRSVGVYAYPGDAALDELRHGIQEIEFMTDHATGQVQVGCPESTLLPFCPQSLSDVRKPFSIWMT
jgi:hypothetical protein